MEAVLNNSEYNLVTARSGSEAVEKSKFMEFAVVLLDVQMPGMDGFETAQKIRAQNSNRPVPIIFVTAINKDDKHVFHGYEVGGVDYLFKPFYPRILQAKVAVFVELYRKNEKILRQSMALRMAENRERDRVLAKMEL